jgi:hypothetical protein
LLIHTASLVQTQARLKSVDEQSVAASLPLVRNSAPLNLLNGKSAIKVRAAEWPCWFGKDFLEPCCAFGEGHKVVKSFLCESKEYCGGGIEVADDEGEELVAEHEDRLRCGRQRLDEH